MTPKSASDGLLHSCHINSPNAGYIACSHALYLHESGCMLHIRLTAGKGCFEAALIPLTVDTAVENSRRPGSQDVEVIG